MTLQKVSLLFLIMSSVFCEGQEARSDVALPQLPAGLRDKLNSGYWVGGAQSQNIPIIKEKCAQNARRNPFAEEQDPLEEAAMCYRSIQHDTLLENIGTTSQMNEVMDRFCAKTSQMKECFNKLVTRIRPCLTADEIPHLQNIQDGESNLLGFVCYNDGERVTRFVKEEGPKCIEDQITPITSCLNELNESNWLRNIEASGATAANIFEGPHVNEMCTKVVGLKKCVVRALGRCEHAYPAQFVDSVVNTVLRGTPCKDLVPSQAAGVRGALALLAAAAGAALLL